jgi:hypothetical protein
MVEAPFISFLQDFRWTGHVPEVLKRKISKTKIKTVVKWYDVSGRSRAPVIEETTRQRELQAFGFSGRAGRQRWSFKFAWDHEKTSGLTSVTKAFKDLCNFILSNLIWGLTLIVFLFVTAFSYHGKLAIAWSLLHLVSLFDVSPLTFAEYITWTSHYVNKEVTK